jgi:hypothetical protein
LTKSPTPPPAPLIPLTPALRSAYQNLLATYETAIENTTDPGVLEALNSSRTNVDDVLTKDSIYKLEATTALYEALLQQISDTNDELAALQAQILAISSGISTFGNVLSAIGKVMALFPAA